MRISELTTALLALRAEHGDLVVKVVFEDMPGAGFGGPLDIEVVYRSHEGWAAVDLDGYSREEWEAPADGSREEGTNT